MSVFMEMYGKSSDFGVDAAQNARRLGTFHGLHSHVKVCPCSETDSISISQ
jgi:hypothetical protein